MLALLLAMTLTGFDPSVLTVPIETVPIENPKEIAVRIATSYHLNVDKFLAVINCESEWNTTAKGDYRNGKPTSFGLAQLHNPKRDWGITIEQAYVPEIALTLMAKAWNKGEAWRWSCWKAIYGD